MDLKLKDCSKLKLTNSLITELEYIQSSEGQYIIIPLKPTSKMTYECHAEMSETADCTVFMSRTSTSANQLGIMLTGSKKLSLRYHSGGVGGDKNYVAGKVYYHSAIENNKYVAYYNNTKTGESNINTSFSNNYNICIFGRNTAGTIATYTGAIVKLYDLKFYNDAGELVMDLVPCKDTNGVVCLYDVVSETYHYNSASGELIAGPEANVRNLSTYNTNLLEKITSLYVKDCPNILSFGLLSKILEVQASIQDKLSRVRLNIGTQTGSLNFLMNLVGLNGFNDNYEQQVKPRLIGTYTINDYYFPDDLVSAQQAIDGLTIVGDNNYALSSNMLAVQTFDPEAENYNPAVAIILANNGIGTILDEPKIEGGGRYYLPKAVAANITLPRIFAEVDTVIDFNGIVTNDITQSYDFESFIEYKFFHYGFNIAVNSVGDFCNCKKLKEIAIPEGQQILNNYAIKNNDALEKLYLPSTFNKFDVFNFTTSYLDIYFNFTLEQYFNVSLGSGGINVPHNVYFNGIKLTTLIIPNNITNIKAGAFRHIKDLEEIVIPNSVTSIGEFAFDNCTNLTGNLVIPCNVGQSVFANCKKLNSVKFLAGLTIGRNSVQSAIEGGLLISKSNILVNTTLADKIYVDGILTASTIIRSNPSLPVTTTSISQIEHFLEIRMKTYSGTDNYGFTRNSQGKPSVILGFAQIYNFTTTNDLQYWNYGLSNSIFHFCNSSILCNRTSIFKNTNELTKTYLNNPRIAKIYVGTGSSRAADQATLALYLADSDWGNYSSKLDIWYDYHGEYRNYNPTYNLTNVTCSNVLEWPYPIRNDAYETELIPDDGYTLSTVQVTMLDTDSNSPTYDTMVDITNDVYDASTHTISIPAITGDIVITAIAV